MTEPAATLERFKTHLNKTSVDDDDELLSFLRAATKMVEEGTDFNIGPIITRQVTARVESSAGVFILPSASVVSVDSVVPANGSSSVDVSGLDVDSEAGIIRPGTTSVRNGRHVVTYTAGRATTAAEVPDDIQLAVCIVGKYLWDTQRGRLGNRSGTSAEATTEASGSFEMNRAKALLRHYRLS